MSHAQDHIPGLPTSGTSVLPVVAPAADELEDAATPSGSAERGHVESISNDTQQQHHERQEEDQQGVQASESAVAQAQAQAQGSTQRVEVPDISISRPSTSSIVDNNGHSVGRTAEDPSQPDQSAPADQAELAASTSASHESQQGDVLPTPPAKDEPLPDTATATSGSASASTGPTMVESSEVSRRSSVASTTASTTTTVHSRSSMSSLNKGSAVFVITALDTISSSKEAKGSKAPAKALKDASTRALEMVRAASSSSAPGSAGAELDPRVVFEPLRLAMQTRSTTLTITALDCVAKLVSYSFFAEDAPVQEGQEALADAVTSTVCDAFHDALDEKAQLQVVKALLSIVLSTSVHVHQSSLLKAVRTTYNIFLLSKSAPTQAVAQGVLTQMVHHVFGRVPRGLENAASSSNDAASASAEHLLSPPRAVKTPSAPLSGPGERVVEAEDHSSDHRGGEATTASAPSDQSGQEEEVDLRDGEDKGMGGNEGPDDKSGGEQQEERVTLQALEARASFEGASERDTGASLLQQAHITQAELFVKDAFLVLRALCKLSMKPLGAESERDLRSHAMRSKLLSLHLILTILKSHMTLFTDPSIVIHSASTGEQTQFVHAVKQYLCLSLSRNAVSSVNQVFELSCEIFWLVLSGMRTRLKREIEVLLNEIFLPILEMRNSTAKQKSILLGVLIRLCQDPQALVEMYLNYDCDRSALDNIYERLMNIISKISQTHLASGTQLSSDAAGASTSSSGAAQRTPASGGPSIPPSLSSSTTASAELDSLGAGQPLEMRLKKQSLDCLCSVLRSLVVWSSRANLPQQAGSLDGTRLHSPRGSEDVRGQDGVTDRGDASLPRQSSGIDSGTATPVLGSATDGATRTSTPDQNADDPNRFESAKARKTSLLEGIKRFNFKPKRGIEYLLQQGFIRAKEPKQIAHFLLFADGLNKAQIGEYLGEGEPENIAIMHAFVDLLNFTNMPFTDALRRFLQAFRLPGEAQKIDRYMLKFAERYVAGNPTMFANADTAYVFAYSVIMLNTDAHNPRIKNRMSLPDFVKNNAGIDDGKDLPEDYIKGVYDEIQNNEIKMKDEVPASALPPGAIGGGLANAIAGVGRDLQREAYVLQSEGMANKTEALFRTMVRTQRRVHPEQRAAAERFFSASHFEHVRPMFEVAWMAFLTGISGPMQESDDTDTVSVCLEGFRDAIRIVSLFGLELERNAFVTTLAKFTFLNNLGEMKSKNVEAIKALLGVAQTEGNYLQGSWRELLTCVSQLERFQLISGGVDERQLPELGRRASAAAGATRASTATPRAALPTDDVVQAGASREVTIAADMVFSSTPHLSGTAIVDFVQSLSDVSWEEIQSSGMSENPRLFSLQKLVEISYYNMSRIRLEWSSIWAILGEHFNQVCVHPNPRVSAFGLDSLRQLSARFLEKEELQNFKFQKDFLKPFEYTMRNNPSSEAKEMVLQCLQQMIASRIHNMRSGWRTLFGVLGAASKASERVATYAFELVRQLNQEHFGAVISAGAFADLTVCLTDFAKATHAQRLALQSVTMLRAIVPMMLGAAECPIDAETDPGPAASQPMADDPMVRFWFPALFSFYDVIMNGDDLEVRRVALDALFEILKQYGSTFRPDFWDTVCKEVLFPIFAVLRSRSDVTRFSTQEDMSVWLSTTMIQALRNLIDLWTFYFETLERLLPGLLDLLCACICQENDTLARIGTSCLQQLLEKNVRKFSPERWAQVVDTFVQLFRTTTAHQLFERSLRVEETVTSPTSARSELAPSGSAPNGFTAAPLSPNVPVNSPAADAPPAPLMTQSQRRRAFKQIIVKCVLQLLLIETTHELLQKGPVYEVMPPAELLRLTHVLDDSYRFSRRFNADKELRMALWKVGFMKQLPNLLKQESSSAATLVSVLNRMHSDNRPSHRAMRSSVRETLVPLGEDVINAYLPLDVETQARNIAAWTPVVAEVFTGLNGFADTQDESVFPHYASTFYPLAVELLSRPSLAPELLRSLHSFFRKTGFSSAISMPLMTQASEAERRRKVADAKERTRTRVDDGATEGSPLATRQTLDETADNSRPSSSSTPRPSLVQPNGALEVDRGSDAPPLAVVTDVNQQADSQGREEGVTPTHAPTPPLISDADGDAREVSSAVVSVEAEAAAAAAEVSAGANGVHDAPVVDG